MTKLLILNAYFTFETVEHLFFKLLFVVETASFCFVLLLDVKMSAVLPGILPEAFVAERRQAFVGE